MTEVAKKQNNGSKSVRRKLHKKNQRDLLSELNDLATENIKKQLANCESSTTDPLIDFFKLDSSNDMPSPSKDAADPATRNMLQTPRRDAQDVAHQQDSDAQGPTDLKPSIKIEDAIVYLKDIKKTIADKGLPRDLYSQFANIMSRAINQGSDVVEIIKSVVGIFKNHPDLIAKFSPFLPAGYKIEIIPSSAAGFPYAICVQVPCAGDSTQKAYDQSSITLVPVVNDLQSQINELQSHTHELQMRTNELKSRNNFQNGSSYVDINNSTNGSSYVDINNSTNGSSYVDINNSTNGSLYVDINNSTNGSSYVDINNSTNGSSYVDIKIENSTNGSSYVDINNSTNGSSYVDINNSTNGLSYVDINNSKNGSPYTNTNNSSNGSPYIDNSTNGTSYVDVNNSTNGSSYINNSTNGTSYVDVNNSTNGSSYVDINDSTNGLSYADNSTNGSSYVNTNNSTNGSFDYKCEASSGSSGSSGFSEAQTTSSSELISGFDSDDIYDFVSDYAMPSPDDITYTEIIMSDSDLPPLQNGNLSNFDYELITISSLQNENGIVNSLLPLEQMMPLGGPDILANPEAEGTSTSCNETVNNCVSDSLVSVAQTNGLRKGQINGSSPDCENNSFILRANNCFANSISQNGFGDDVSPRGNKITAMVGISDDESPRGNKRTAMVGISDDVSPRGNKITAMVGNILQDCEYLSVPSPSKRPKST